MFVIPFPHINPYIIKFGELGITWYSLSYVFGIILGWQYCNYLIKKSNSPVTIKLMDEFITWIIIAIIAGGRLGHVMLYEPLHFLTHPIEIFQTYKGGMSFHGGFAGVGIAVFIFCKKYKVKFFDLSDLLAVGAPIGLGLGRVANFINGELYGSVTTMPWGVVFPGGGDLPRHPSQLYEALTEGLLLLVVMSYFAFKNEYYLRKGFLTGVFVAGYAISRFVCEIFRIPDFEFMGLSAGQLYSVPMFVIGVWFVVNAKYQKTSYVSVLARRSNLRRS